MAPERLLVVWCSPLGLVSTTMVRSLSTLAMGLTLLTSVGTRDLTFLTGTVPVTDLSTLLVPGTRLTSCPVWLCMVLASRSLW